MRIDLSAEWTPAQAEFDAFARLSGDDNPIHTDPAYAARTPFGRTVSHGMLIYARLWGLLHSARPGTAERRQALMFPAPCFADEPVTLTVAGEAPGRLALRAVRGDGAEVLVGEAEVD
ncbi:hypothetical protein OG2516_06489 [Oceanicola granulosus HTCC2516]|uniref:MaoC-like domain-containing protein n=1 Tax=Oceanicola granulosus (strain ATCC BAA-861 / DSM 15982 / KCTC 12143 / HTCC2516) TaxID=314256 RepID=Q2CBN4_OCEGH|nr:MaoC/PaaZ C-terminal domain-containing protein [Oceanicola granulosus]EAR50097.1 hypothetical protein OG2516_06489 [Oceanicola granulosus HTCC2516]